MSAIVDLLRQAGRRAGASKILLIAAMAGVSGPASTQSASLPLGELKGFIEQGLRDWETPGLVLSVVKDDRVTLEAGYGSRRAGQPERMDEHTRVGIGSTSKAFGAAAIAHLVSQGKMSWDDRVTTYLPWFALNDPWVTHEVRVRDILSHRTGMDLTDENRLLAVATDTQDFLRRLRHLRPAAPFRSNYVYSNAMFTTAGEVIAAVSGKPWDAYVREVIWQPLGMSETGANLDEALRSANHATPHAKVGTEIRALPGWEPERVIFEKTGPSGAVISTAHDMSQWLRLQLGDGTIDGRTLIDAEIFHDMHEPHTPMRDMKGATSWFKHLSAAEVQIADQSYAMGWRVSRYRGRPMIWHGGTVSGFRTVVAFMPEERIAVFVNGNRESLFPFAVVLTAFDAYLGVDGPDWSALFLNERRLQEADAREQEAKLAAARVARTKPSLALSRYAGSYADGGAFGRIEVRHQPAGLGIKLGWHEGVLEHWHYDLFRIRWSGLVPEEGFARFEIGTSGAPVAVVIEDVGRFQHLPREDVKP